VTQKFSTTYVCISALHLLNERGQKKSSVSFFDSRTHICVVADLGELKIKCCELLVHFWVVEAALVFEACNVVFAHNIAEKFLVKLFEKCVRCRTSLTQLHLRKAHLQKVEPNLVDREVGVPHTYIVVQDKVEEGNVCILVRLEVYKITALLLSSR
jgi:hypothetical protein